MTDDWFDDDDDDDDGESSKNFLSTMVNSINEELTQTFQNNNGSQADKADKGDW
jgi:hypothetical protein